MIAHPRDRARFDWLDRFILPAGTPIAPSRWHQHVVQRQVSPLDHLRPHRLTWDALKHPESAAEVDDDPLTPRRLAGIRWSWLDGRFTTVSENLYLGFIVLYALAYGATTSELGPRSKTSSAPCRSFRARVRLTPPATESRSLPGPSAASPASPSSRSRSCRA